MDFIMDFPVHFRSFRVTRGCGNQGMQMNIPPTWSCWKVPQFNGITPELLQPLVVVACCRHQTFETWICWCHSIFPRFYPIFFAVMFQYFLLHRTHLLVMSLRIYFSVFTQPGGIQQQILHAKTQMHSHVLSMFGNITLLIYSRRKDKKEDEQHVI